MIAILDTGPWVSLIDRSESRHAECVQWLKNFSGRLYSTEAVLTEVLYLLNFSIIAQCAALDFVLESVVEIVPAGTKSLKKTKNFMKKYSRPTWDWKTLSRDTDRKNHFFGCLFLDDVPI